MGKKALLGLVLAGLVVAVLGTASLVHAQSIGPTGAQTPQALYGPGMGYGPGRGARGGMGFFGNSAAGAQTGFMHDEMIAAFAQKLGMSPADLNALLAQGQTLAQVAASKGYSAEQFAALWSEARGLALDQAVKDGKITQAQADWMKLRGAGRRGGMMGGGRAGVLGCPYFSQTSQ